MKKLLLIIIVLALSGCAQWEAERIAQREALMARFQAAYPDTWQRELLKYDAGQERLQLEHRRQAQENLQRLAEKGRREQTERGRRAREATYQGNIEHQLRQINNALRDY